MGVNGTSRISVLLEELIVGEPVKMMYLLYGIRKFIPVPTTALHLTLP
jgi:hypothetical protein